MIDNELARFCRLMLSICKNVRLNLLLQAVTVFIPRITKCILRPPVSPGKTAAAPVFNASADEFNPLVQVPSPVSQPEAAIIISDFTHFFQKK